MLAVVGNCWVRYANHNGTAATSRPKDMCRVRPTTSLVAARRNSAPNIAPVTTNSVIESQKQATEHCAQREKNNSSRKPRFPKGQILFKKKCTRDLYGKTYSVSSWPGYLSTSHFVRDFKTYMNSARCVPKLAAPDWGLCYWLLLVQLATATGLLLAV